MTKTHQVGGSGADYIVPVGMLALLGIGGYFLINKLGLFSGSSPGLNQANQQATNSVNTGTQQTAADQAAKGEKATLSAVQAAGIANSVYTAGVSSDDRKEWTVTDQIVQVNNLTDLNNVIAAFGTRSTATSTSIFDSCYQLGLNCQKLGLADFVRVVNANTDGAALQSLNLFLSGTGINYQF